MGWLKNIFANGDLGVKVKRIFFYALLFGTVMFCLVPVTVVNFFSSHYYTNKIIEKYKLENAENLNSVMLNNSRLMQEIRTYIKYSTDKGMAYFGEHPFYDDIVRYLNLLDRLSAEVSNAQYIDSVYLYSQRFDYLTALSSNGVAFKAI